MDLYIAIFFGLMFATVSLILSILVRNQKISAKNAAFATAMTFIVQNIIFLYVQKIDWLGMLCTSVLYIAIGAFSYAPYKWLEVKFKRDSQK